MFGGRIVGMNRRQKPAQLLSIVGNKPRLNRVPKAFDDPPASSDEEGDNEAVTDNHHEIHNAKHEAMPPLKIKVPKAFDGPPVSNDEEEGNGAVPPSPLKFKVPKAFDGPPVSNDEEEGYGAVPPSPLKFKVPKAFDDPPVSSDEEAGNEAVTDNLGGASNAKKRTAAKKSPELNRHRDAIPDSSGSSSDERMARASIKRTNFGKAIRAGRLLQRTKRKSDDMESLESETKLSGNAQTASKRRRLNEKTPATYGQGKAAYKAPSSSGEHLTDECGFTKVKPSKLTYRKKNTNSKEQLERKEATTTSESKLKVPAPFDSPKKSESSKLRVPNGSAPSSPPDSPSGNLVLKHHKDDDVPDNMRSSPETKSVLQTTGFKAKGTRINGPKRWIKKQIARSPSPPPAVFKFPAQISELARRTSDVKDQSDGELSGILSDAERDGRPSDVEPVDAGEEPTAVRTVCPWCGEPVDKALLDESSKGKRMNVRQQSRFCQKHRKQTAVEIWQANGYPEVDWQVLDERFSKHQTLLLDIVNGKSSHFRSILGEKIQSGQARSMKKENNLNPGYYGPRGFNLMCDYLVNEFGDLLKEKAVDDRVIAGRGSAAFIQSVLVAELAVQLIKDDMGVSVEDARDIMEESKALGEMVHEEV